MNATFIHKHWCFWLVVVIALVLRLPALSFGLPQEFDPDEFVYILSSISMLSAPYWDPGWYGAPGTTLFSILAVVFGSVSVLFSMLGLFDAPSDFSGLLYAGDASLVYIVARATTLLTGLLCLGITYLVGKHIVNKYYAASACLILACSPLMVHYSAVVRMDMLQMTFMLLVVYQCMRMLQQPDDFSRYCAWAGVFVGLSVTSKYPGVISVVPILVTLFHLDALHWSRRIRGLFLAGASSLLAAFLAAPYLFINIKKVLGDIAVEARVEHLSQTSEGFVSAIWKYVSHTFVSDLGTPITLVGILGLLFMLFAGKTSRIFASLFFGYLFFIASLNLWWDRWALPLLPFVCVAVAWAVQNALSRITSLQTSTKERYVALSVVALLLVPVAANGFGAYWLKASDADTRIRSKQWIEQNLPASSGILLETYAPQLSVEDHRVYVLQNNTIALWSDKNAKPIALPSGIFADAFGEQAFEGVISMLQQQGIDYLVMSDFYDRFSASSNPKFNRQRAFYQSLLQSYPVIAEFSPAANMLGRSIRVVAINE